MTNNEKCFAHILNTSRFKTRYKRINLCNRLFGPFSINMDIASGSLAAVVGPVGSGKSSLLSALLGETEKLKGSVAVEVLRYVSPLFFSYVVYVSQHKRRGGLMVSALDSNPGVPGSSHGRWSRNFTLIVPLST